jgi:hypothetical protein
MLILEKVLREQELLIRPTVDLVSWTTFNLIGDLAFGVPFDCLGDESYHFFSAIYFNISKPTTLSEWPRST